MRQPYYSCNCSNHQHHHPPSPAPPPPPPPLLLVVLLVLPVLLLPPLPALSTPPTQSLDSNTKNNNPKRLTQHVARLSPIRSCLAQVNRYPAPKRAFTTVTSADEAQAIRGFIWGLGLDCIRRSGFRVRCLSFGFWALCLRGVGCCLTRGGFKASRCYLISSLWNEITSSGLQTAEIVSHS